MQLFLFFAFSRVIFYIPYILSALWPWHGSWRVCPLCSLCAPSLSRDNRVEAQRLWAALRSDTPAPPSFLLYLFQGFEHFPLGRSGSSAKQTCSSLSDVLVAFVQKMIGIQVHNQTTTIISHKETLCSSKSDKQKSAFLILVLKSAQLGCAFLWTHCKER